MRPRNKKHLEERFEKCSNLVIADPVALKGKWRSVFVSEDDKEMPLHLEIGCGKGAFVTGMAQKNPDVSFVAMECVKNVIVTAMEKTETLGYKNIIFINNNADFLCEYFEEGEVDKIYLNFSDPWPRNKHAKYRLTHENYLKRYEKILAPDGCIVQKTDNRGLFDYSVESFTENGWRLENVTYNLHSDETPAEILAANVITEYENRFMELGQPIHRLEAYLPKR